MIDIKIVGKTNSQFINLLKISLKNGTLVKPFLMDEYFIVEDELNNNPICRVIDTYQVQFINCEYKNDIIAMGFSENDIENIYIGKAQIEKEIYYPINIKSSIREPKFDEIKDLLYTNDIDKGLSIGEIRGTEKIYSTIPDGWNNAVCMMNASKITEQTRAIFSYDFRKMEQFPHCGLFGGSGSGKTFALKVIIEELIKKHMPTIVLDPHYEMSFDNNIKEIPENLKYDFAPYVETFVIGENIGIDFTQLETASLIDILKFSGDISPAMEEAIYAVHKQGDTYELFRQTLDDIISAFQEAESNKNSYSKKDNPPLYEKYSKRVSGLSTLIAVSWRVSGLERRGVFKSNTIDLEAALKKQKTCVIRGPVQLLNIVGSYVSNVVYEKRRAYVDGVTMKKDAPYFVPFIIIMDEAHSFAPSDSKIKSPMNTILETISKEGRKYGVFEILATQRPKLLNPTISAQLSTKFVFRTVDKNDIEAIKRETDLDENSLSRLPFMEAGACFVSSAINGKCMSVKIRANISTAKITVSPFDELKEVVDFNEEFKKEVLNLLPIDMKNITSVQTIIEKKLDTKMTLPEFQDKLDKLVKDKVLTKSGIAQVYKKMEN